MLSVIAAIAAALWQSKVGRPAIIAGGLFFSGFGVGFIKGHSWADAPGAAARARQASDQHWTQEIRKSNAEADEKIREAIRAGEGVPPTRDRGDLERLCNGAEADPNCHKEDLQRLPGVR